MTSGQSSFLYFQESDLGDYKASGDRIRALCPVHKGDHQKSLSVNRSHGWGHCYNASCNATVLIQELNREVAHDLLKRYQTVAVEPDPLNDEREDVEEEELEPEPPRKKPACPAANWQQDEYAALLRHSDLLCRALFDYHLVDCWQAQAYLESRHIPLEIVDQERLAYFPKELLRCFPDQSALARWSERLLFPLTSPTGRGFAGRSLWHWQLNIDEATHKAMLDEPGAPRRWLKTNPAGWFCAPPIEFGDRLILVEGPFDRLALLAAGFASNEVIALVGTTLQPDWLPEQVKHIVLALDGDDAGIASILRLVELIADDDPERELYLCPPPDDRRGKDWSERWNKDGADGLAELLSTFDLIP